MVAEVRTLMMIANLGGASTRVICVEYIAG